MNTVSSWVRILQVGVAFFKFRLTFFRNVPQLNGITLQKFSLFTYLTNMFYSNVSRLKILPPPLTWRPAIWSVNFNKGIFVQSLMLCNILPFLHAWKWRRTYDHIWIPYGPYLRIYRTSYLHTVCFNHCMLMQIWTSLYIY